MAAPSLLGIGGWAVAPQPWRILHDYATDFTGLDAAGAIERRQVPWQ